MDVETRISDLLLAKPVVPDYASKLSHLGRMMVHQVDDIDLDPNSIVLSFGQPNPCLAPFDDISIRMKDGNEISVEKSHIALMNVYSHIEGFPELREFMQHVQVEEHNPPQLSTKDHPSKFDLCMIPGITYGLQSLLKATMDPDGSDTLLMEDVCYSSFIQNVKTHGISVQGVKYDMDGMVPEALEDTLSNWHQQHPGKTFPKMLYAVTTANNPMGHNWTLSRMLDVYLICRKYDLLIVEDGAYYFLQYGERERSYQSFDIDGRVLRFDSFSKILGAGYRMAWVSGPHFLVDKIIINNELTCGFVSAVAQACIYRILKHWGYDGFIKHTRTVANFYKRRAERIQNACDKYLTGLATWTKPKGGMFTWITINDVTDSTDVLRELEKTHNVRVLKGEYFQTDGRVNNSMRLCYSLAFEEDLVKGIKCLSESIQKITSSKEV